MSGAEGYSRIVGPRRLSVCGSAGFCFGVGRAVDMAMSLTEALPEVYCAGPLVHNGRVLEELQARGLRIAGDLSEVPPNAHILIRSHGASRELRQSLEGRPVTDATCPCVARIHDIVRRAGPDTHILMLGDPEHPEVRATASWCRSVSVFDGPEALETLSRAHPEWESMSLIAVAQTTASLVLWEVCVDFLKKAYTNAQILDTICHATSMRQQEAAAMSAQTDVMFVVGDRKSSNTNRLAGVCERAVLIQSADELDGYRSEILSSGHIGITAGASTPASTIKEVVEKMTEEMKKAEQAAGPETTREIAAPAEDAAAAENLDPAEEAAPAEETVSAETEPVAAPDAVDPAVTAAETEPADAPEAEAEPVAEPEPEPVKAEAAAAPAGTGESFEELLEASLKTLISGDKVTGVISGITPTEIQVELGTKHAGYIPLDELSDEAPENVVAALKVGQEIETFVVRVNDVEGTAMLSKKRLDTVKSWETVENATNTREILEGVVVEENRGGVVVSVKGVRVFIPSSQTGIGRDVPLSSLLKTKVQLRVTEFNRARRRIVGSIRSVLQETRRAQSEAIWDSIEAGRRYDGVVKSLTSYGAFVDIGGIDGMVHVSEISWSRIKQPSDVLSPGDQVEVYVISFDREKKKISLGHRKPEDNPWNVFLKTYGIGDVFSAKVVRLMAFGAFCEILPGVDGLIHISQLADHRVDKPSDVVSEGDTVTVKLTDIDFDRKKISLSIRALIEERQASEPPPDDSGEDEIVATSDEGGRTVIAEGLTEDEPAADAPADSPAESEALQDRELNDIAGAVAEAVTEVAREEAAGLEELSGEPAEEAEPAASPSADGE